MLLMLGQLLITTASVSMNWWVARLLLGHRKEKTLNKEEKDIVKDALLDIVEHEIDDPQVRIEAARMLLNHFGYREMILPLKNISETVEKAVKENRGCFNER